MGLLAKLTGRSGTGDETIHNKKNASRYRGVQVIADAENCCAAAQTIEGNRYLAHQVPKLPLENCESPHCRCTFQLYDDRRTDLRRTSDIGYDMASEFRTGEDRRTGFVGRGKSDR